MIRRLSQHFTLDELTRSPTASRYGLENVPTPDQERALESLCLHVLEPTRAIHGRALVLSSGFRCRPLNTLVGGKTRSQHMADGGRCAAADFEVPGVDNLALARAIEASPEVLYDQLILEFHVPGQPSSGWVHASWAAHPRREVWTYWREGHRVLRGRGLPAADGSMPPRDHTPDES